MVGLLYYKVSSGPFLSYETEIGDGPGPEPDNNMMNDGLFLIGFTSNLSQKS